LYGGKHYQDFDPEVVCRTVAGIWLQGMRPENKNGRSKRLARKNVKKHRVN
jgi:hypothetical protein